MISLAAGRALRRSGENASVRAAIKNYAVAGVEGGGMI